MSFSVFDTNYTRNNQDVLRWASVAVAGFLAVVTLIWAAMVWNSQSFNEDVEKAANKESAEGLGGTMGSNKTMRLICIALFFLVTIAATFLSWYVAALHMAKNNLIATDTLNVLIVILLSLAAYFFYKRIRSRGAATSCVGTALALEFVTLIVLLASPTASGPNGTLTQSALYIPLLVTTIGALMMPQ